MAFAETDPLCDAWQDVIHAVRGSGQSFLQLN